MECVQNNQLGLSNIIKYIQSSGQLFNQTVLPNEFLF